MADNFNLRSFLTENKLTKNAKLLKEEQEGYRYFEEEGNGGFYLGTADGHKVYSMEDSSVMDTCFYAIEDPEGYVEFVGIDVAGEPISSEQLQNEYELLSYVADFIEADIAKELGQEEGEEMEEGADDKGKMARTHVAYSASVTLGDEDGRQYIQHIRASVRKGEDAEQRAAKLIQKHFEDEAENGDPFVNGKFIKINAIGKVLNPERSSIKEPQITEKKKPMMKETKLTAKERRLVEMVNNAMGFSEGEENPNHEFGTNAVTGEPLPNPNDTMVVEDEMAEETVIPEYKNIEELLKGIEEGTNKVAEEHKIQEMKKIAQMLREKAKKMEESEHAAHISPKDLKQLATDAAKLEKAAEKLKATFDKKFNKKEKAAAPKAEKVEALQEGTFDLRKFLAENRKK